MRNLRLLAFVVALMGVMMAATYGVMSVAPILVLTEGGTKATVDGKEFTIEIVGGVSGGVNNLEAQYNMHNAAGRIQAAGVSYARVIGYAGRDAVIMVKMDGVASGTIGWFVVGWDKPAFRKKKIGGGSFLAPMNGERYSFRTYLTRYTIVPGFDVYAVDFSIKRSGQN